jgi:hypothetical protein
MVKDWPLIQSIRRLLGLEFASRYCTFFSILFIFNAFLLEVVVYIVCDFFDSNYLDISFVPLSSRKGQIILRKIAQKRESPSNY